MTLRFFTPNPNYHLYSVPTKIAITIVMMVVLLHPASSFAQPVLPSPLYRVAFVTEDDTLNVRSGAGVDYSVVGELVPDTTDITITGAEQVVEDAIGTAWWVPIQYGSLTGWVNRYFLTEQISSEVFCDESAALQLIDDFKAAIEAQDGDQLQALASTRYGLLTRLHWWDVEVRLTPDEVGAFFNDPTSRVWGYGDGSGLPIEGTASEVMVPLLQQDLNGGEIAECNKVVGGPTAGMLEFPPEYSAINFFSIYRPAPDNLHEFDWGTWVVGIEYEQGQSVIRYLVHYDWEI
ncbi:MAG TPA: SH3 domain-containing protein [Phototrophicaceae bacterium]|nr:SH3 domain-containing protein [Phototrophicaceae bacterium]